MKGKLLFAKTQTAKFLFALLPLVALLAACNFVGGQEARTIVAGTNKPAPYTPPNGGGDEGTTLNGFFKSPIDGLDIQIWAGDGGDFLFSPPHVESVGSGWWGGAIIGAGNTEYDVSKIASVKFDIVSEVDTEIWVTVFGDDANKETFNLKAGEKQIGNAIKIESSKNTSVNLFSFGGEGFPAGKKITITNFTFYDSNGNEVVPKYLADGNMGGGNDDSTKLTLGGVPYILRNSANTDDPSGVFFGKQGNWEPVENQPVVEQTADGIKITVKDANGTEQWKGQVHLESELDVKANTYYDITYVINSSQEFDQHEVSLKAHLVGSNDPEFGAPRKKLEANKDMTFKFEKKSLAKGGKFAVVFDFPGCQSGTVILIKEIAFKKSADQTSEPEEFSIQNNALNGKGDIVFNYESVENATEYKIYVDNGASPAHITNSSEKRIEGASYENVIQYKPQCRKLCDVFTEGAKEYAIKVVPVVNGQEQADKAQFSHLNLTEEQLGWHPQMNNPKAVFEEQKLTISFESIDNDISTFNIFIKENGKDSVINEYFIKRGEKADNTIEITDFNKDNGKYDVIIEPLKDGQEGSNVAICEFTKS